jgi:putative ABC transport system permease protein
MLSLRMLKGTRNGSTTPGASTHGSCFARSPRIPIWLRYRIISGWLSIRISAPGDARFKSELFLHPMSRWYFYSDFKNGVNVGGRIQYVWLFGIIGIFVLLLACINFMNLSTARSERRAREVGIRKAIGSLRGQLIGQFFAESVLTAFLAFALALLLVSVSLPVFSDLAGKQLVMPWAKPLFWTAGICFCGLTGLIAGSYPALYLSSFRPVEVLKGNRAERRLRTRPSQWLGRSFFRGGRLTVLPRQVLVVLQFTVSVSLIIGTVVVFRQVRHARERPMGYDQSGYPRPFRCRQAGTARCRCYRRHGAGQRPGDGYLEH